jgi:K+-sensing histidine kinase KdpD
VIPPLRRWPAGIAVGALLVAAVSALVWLLEPYAPVRSLGVFYLLAVLPVAIVWGVLPAVAVSFLSVAVFVFVFIPPSNSFDFDDPGEWLALSVLLVIAIVVSELAARQRREKVEVAQLEKEQTALRRVATMEVPRHGLAVVAEGNRVHFVAGGPQPRATYSDAHEVLTV